MRFRKKPVEIVAHRIGDDGWPDEIWEGVNQSKITLHMTSDDPHVIIETLEGQMRGNVGDWIIRGVAGEFYPCKHYIFEATYEKIKQNVRETDAWKSDAVNKKV